MGYLNNAQLARTRENYVDPMMSKKRFQCVNVAGVQCIVLKSIIGSASDAALLQFKRTIKGTISGSGPVSSRHSQLRGHFSTVARHPKILSPTGLFDMPNTYLYRTSFYQYFAKFRSYDKVPNLGLSPEWDQSPKMVA